MSIYSEIKKGLPDAVFGVLDKYNNALKIWNADDKKKEEDKPISVIIGAYRDEGGAPWPLPSVRKVESELSQDPNLTHEYLPMTGFLPLKQHTQNLIFGCVDDSIISSQSLSGTGALSLGCQFLRTHLGCTKVVIPDPTWPNHKNIAVTNLLTFETYPYYDYDHNAVNFENLISNLSSVSKNTIVILHPCAHNPTGCDLNMDQWNKLLDMFVKRAVEGSPLIIFFDCAYQGYATGNLDEDVASIRLFYKKNQQLKEENKPLLSILVAQSFSKNFGLYGERIGMLHITTASAEEAKRVTSQLVTIIRATYSNPPTHGARIVSTILGNETKFKEWLHDLRVMTERLQRMRLLLKAEIEKEQARVLTEVGEKDNVKVDYLKKHTWEHITNQKGMFSFTGLQPTEVDYIENQHKIFMTRDGRISIAGLTEKNIARVGRAVVDSILKA